MYHHILVPLENSSSDSVILDHIRALAKHFHAQLTLVHVADGFAARLQDQLNLKDSEEIKKDRAYLQHRQKELSEEGLKVNAHLLTGDPSTQILTLAENEEVDLIAMATHGHRFLEDLFWGSVAESVRHRTNIPILMIRAGK